MTTFLVQVQGGLANRLMALISAIRVAKITGHSLKVVWEPNEFCHCRLRDLFQTDLEVIETDGADIPGALRFAPDGSGRLIILPVQDIVGRDVVIRSHHLFYLDTDMARMAQFGRQETATQLQAAFNALLPVPYISESVARHAEGVENGIGLHVRRPISLEASFPDRRDHSRMISVWNSPDDEFYVHLALKLRESLALSGRIFLSTSCLESRANILRAFPPGDVSFYQARTYIMHAEAEAIQDALIDMLCLSRTAIVTKRNPSTFAFFSSLIGGKPQAIIYDNSSVALKGPLEY